MSSAPPRLQTGQLRSQALLATRATYRVQAWDIRGLVELEAVWVPGMRPGARLRATRAAVEAMDVVTPHPGSVGFGTEPLEVALASV